MYIANIASSSEPSRWPITWMRQLLNDHVAPDVAPRDLYSVAPLFVRPWEHTTAHTMHELHDARHTDATLRLSFSLSLFFPFLSFVLSLAHTANSGKRLRGERLS